jgi:putative membrane protein
MRFPVPAVLAGGLAAVAALTVLDITTSQARPLMDDAAILSAVEYTHIAEIESGELAQSKATSQEVKDMGRSFAEAHKQAQTEVQELAKKLNFELKTHDDDPVKKAHEETKDRLAELEGKAFDKAWVDNEVTFHQTALEKIKAMIPTATNEEVKALLTATQSSVEAHLEAAKGLQGKIVAAQ